MKALELKLIFMKLTVFEFTFGNENFAIYTITSSSAGALSVTADHRASRWTHSLWAREMSSINLNWANRDCIFSGCHKMSTHMTQYETTFSGFI